MPELGDKLARWKTRLASLPSMSLPTDYARPVPEKTVDGRVNRNLEERVARAILRLSLIEEDEDDTEDDASPSPAADGAAQHHGRPSPFQLLLSAFVVLLHRFTSDNDMVLATSSPSFDDPLLLRIGLEPSDSFWALVRKIQFLEKEAEAEVVPFDQLEKALGREQGTGPLFRVRFFDETDKTQTHFLETTSLSTDWTVFLSLADTPDSITSSHQSILPKFALRLHYNSLLFAQPRMEQVLDQLCQVISFASTHPHHPIGNISLVTPTAKQLLPDPTADLEFCGFRGAITDIFSANAARHPDRVCIVESLTPVHTNGNALLQNGEALPNRKRTFTYQQIDRASNVLAHYLIQGGVEREDVVTVYSTRNVDLVVTIMGVLKAGATFSVIGKELHSLPFL